MRIKEPLPPAIKVRKKVAGFEMKLAHDEVAHQKSADEEIYDIWYDWEREYDLARQEGLNHAS